MDYKLPASLTCKLDRYHRHPRTTFITWVRPGTLKTWDSETLLVVLRHVAATGHLQAAMTMTWPELVETMGPKPKKVGKSRPNFTKFNIAHLSPS